MSEPKGYFEYWGKAHEGGDDAPYHLLAFHSPSRPARVLAP